MDLRQEMAIDNFRGSQEVTRAAHTPHVRDIGRLMCRGENGGSMVRSVVNVPQYDTMMPRDSGKKDEIGLDKMNKGEYKSF